MDTAEVHPVLWVIYGMRLESDDEYRYVGLTRIGTERRLYIHRRDALRRRHHVSKWVNKNSENVVIEVIEECPEGDEQYLFDAETRWIKHFRELGHPLTNHSDGGASGSYGARWTIAEEKRRKGALSPNYGKRMSDETKEKLRAKKVGKKRTLESRMKQGASISGENHWTKRSGYVMSEDTKQRIREARKLQAPASAETRMKISEAHRGKTISPEHRAKISAATTGENHHAFGKSAVNKGVPMSDAQKAKLKKTLPKSRCVAWHENRNYVDPNCTVCVERVGLGDVARFSTSDEIAAAKAIWKGNRDITEIGAKISAGRKGYVTSDETKAKISEATKGRPGKIPSAETRAKQSAAKKGRPMGEAQRRGMMLGMHKKWHVNRGITKAGCEYC